MADRGHLTGLSLAAVVRASESPGRRPADGFHRIPEIGGGGLIGDVANLPVQSSMADAVEPLPGELKVIALHINRPGSVADDVDAVVDAGDQVGGGMVLGAGLQRDVGHPLNRHMMRRVGIRATVRARQAQPRRSRSSPVSRSAGYRACRGWRTTCRHRPTRSRSPDRIRLRARWIRGWSATDSWDRSPGPYAPGSRWAP